MKKKSILLFFVAILVLPITLFLMMEKEPKGSESAIRQKSVAVKELTERREALHSGKVSRPKAQDEGLGAYVKRLVSPKLNDVYALLKEGKLEEAKATLLRMLEKDSERLDVLIELSLIELIGKKSPDKALVYLKRGLRIEPSNTGLAKETTKAFITLDRLGEGLEFFLELSHAHPEASSLKLMLAELYASKKEWKKAKKSVNEAIKQGASPYKALALRGRIFLELGDADQAKKDFSAAIAGFEGEIRRRLISNEEVVLLVEELDVVMFNLVEILFQLGDYEKAQSVVGKLAERIPSDPRVVAMMEEIYRIRGARAF